MKEKNTNYQRTEGNDLPESLRVSPFRTPEDYFTKLNQQISSQLNVEKELTDIGSPFSVPTDYFENLTGQIQQKIFLEELKKEVPAAGFTVPDGYFSSLPLKIQEKVKSVAEDDNGQQPKVIRLKKRRTWVKYVAAASILVAGVSGFFSLQNKSGFSETDGYSLSNISEDEIINYLVLSAEADDIIYLSHYFDEHDESTLGTGIGRQSTDEDIEDYINYML